MKWPNHFHNEFHHLHKLLNELEPHTEPSDIILEDATGQPPLLRSRESIPNVNGITDYHVAALVDQAGGNTTLDPPSSWNNVQNFQVSIIHYGIELKVVNSLGRPYIGLIYMYMYFMDRLRQFCFKAHVDLHEKNVCSLWIFLIKRFCKWLIFVRLI